jgi:hypothetical protein
MTKIDTFVAADNYFSQIPHWVLYAEISPQAIRLYCVIHHYANRESNIGWPSRETLSKEIRVNSARTVDAALKELETIGALKINKRFTDKGMQTSNYYTVITAFPGVQNIATGGVQEIATLGVQNIAGSPSKILLTKENHRKITKDKEPSIEFDTFWKAYPRKIEKQKAIIAFNKAISKITLQAMLDSLPNLKALASDISFIPYPATWLNGERWTDERVPIPTIATTPSPRQFSEDDAPIKRPIDLEEIKAVRLALTASKMYS